MYVSKGKKMMHKFLQNIPPNIPQCFSPLSFLKKIQTQKPSQSFQDSPFPQFHSSENQIDSNKSTAVFNSVSTANDPTTQEV